MSVEIEVELCHGADTGVPLARLIGMIASTVDGIALSDHVEGSHGPALYRAVCGMGLEGIVSKRVDQAYRSGRCLDWVKVKNPDAPAATRLLE